jgi:ATP-binding cassette subfamily C protein CydD
MNKRLLREIRHIRAYLAAIVVIAVVMGVLVVAQAAALTRVIGGVFLVQQNVAHVIGLLLALLAIIVARSLLIWGNALLAGRAAAAVKTSLRTRLVAKLQALGPLYLTGERSGELTEAMIEGVESIDAFFSQALPQAFAAVLIPGVISLVALFADPLSGLIFLLTTPVLLVFMYLIGTMAGAYTKKQWSLLSRMSAHFLDVLQGLTTLKLFGRSQAQRETIGRVSDLFRETTMGVLRVAFLSSLVLEMGATISTALVAVTVGLRLLYNQLPFAPAFFVLLLAPDFYLPLRVLGAKFHSSMSGLAASQRIYDILDSPVQDAAQRQDTAKATNALLPRPITFQHVTYSYHDGNDNASPALSDASFVIEPGQIVALIGPSGAGKSTVANLLLRFAEPQEGAILVGDTPLSAIAAHEWRKQIAWIPQRPYLFNSSIAENIRAGRSGATMDEVIAAARKAHIHEFIMSLPSGYDTKIGERGARLSGGQAQRLALARAFLKNAPLLILDEATAHLDHANEEAVLDALHALMGGRMVLIIAHRLHTLHGADRVVVLDGGCVVATGSHRQLLAQSNTYHKFCNACEGSVIA